MNTDEFKKSVLQLGVGEEYSRKSLDKIFKVDTFSKSREGLVYFKEFTFLMVTLEKKNKPQNLQYNDYFEEDFFHWDSQSTQHINSPKIQSMVLGNEETLLFVRELEKIQNKTQPFIYCGRLEYSEHDPETAKPVHLICEVLDYIENASGNLKQIYEWSPDQRGLRTTSKINTRGKTSRRRSKTQGFQNDPFKKKAVELYAMKIATEHYQNNGCVVEDTSNSNPYDLFCKNANMESRRVEVKGTMGSDEEVTVTKNEVKSARDSTYPTDLFIVHSIDIHEKDGEHIASGGEVNLIKEWVPLDNDLTPLSFRYRVPKD